MISFRHFGLSALAGSLALLSAGHVRAQSEPHKQMTLAPTGVDLTTGRFTYEATDLSIGPFTLERSYVGGHAVPGSSHFGLNWTHNYSMYVVEKDRQSLNGIYVVRGRETVHFYQNNVMGGYSSDNPDSFGMKLEIVSGAFVL